MSEMSVAAKSDLPPFKPLPQKPPRINVDRRPDGTIYLSSQYELGPIERSIVHILDRKAAQHPDRPYMAERGKNGEWGSITYGQANRAVKAVASTLLAHGLTPDSSLLILSGNSIPHAIMSLGAMRAGIPAAPVSVPYSTMSSDFSKLKHVVSLTQPRIIFADKAETFARAVAALDLKDVIAITCEGTFPGIETLNYADVITTPESEAARTAFDQVNNDTVAKYLFTSGSTGMPKGVIQTQGMMMAVIASQEVLKTEPTPPDYIQPSLEWMPWNHISAGNITFNRNIAHGGTCYLDHGKPVPGQFEQTIRNLREVQPPVFTSAPIAYGMLVAAMEKDPDLRKSFFRNLQWMIYGGATLSNDVYDRMQALAIQETGHRIVITTSYGATETHGVTGVHWLVDRVGMIGLPMPGLTIKLVPNGVKLEVRVKGPTVTPGYLRDAEKTKAAFDEEGFYCLGDAARFIDPERPEIGLAFDGRVAEDFKLATGTWVSTGTLRTEVVAACSPLVQDVVVCGLDKSCLALLVWPNLAACRARAGLPDSASPEDVVSNAEVIEAIRAKLAAHNKGASSSTRIVRIHLMAEPPLIDAQEITDKGYVNQRATLERRAHLVERLYREPLAEDVFAV